MKGIKRWVMATFGGPKPKLFLELGAHRGQDTAWLAAIPGVTIHCWEPDPRNTISLPSNAILHREAIAAHDGRCQLILSEREVEWGIETGSSSIRKPKMHLSIHPTTLFVDEIEVDCITLDTATREAGIDKVDFIWADVQGAERDMIEGGRETLERTRYLFTEYYDEEMYEGQITLSQILQRLPQFRLMQKWRKDALLANMSLVGPGGAVWKLR